MRCMIIDDEAPAIRILKRYIERLPNLELVGTATNALIGIELIQKEKPDVVFLDIEMEKKNGLEVMKIISENTAIVFCTAYSEMVVRKNALDAVDYLEKPVEFKRFELAVERVREYWMRQRDRRVDKDTDDVI